MRTVGKTRNDPTGEREVLERITAGPYNTQPVAQIVKYKTSVSMI